MKKQKQKEDRVFLREWRLAKGLTQPELARRIGTVKSEISRLENGSRGMTLDWMSALSKGMGISPEDLMSLPPMGFGAVAPAPKRDDPDMHSTWLKFANIEIKVNSGHEVATVTGDDWQGVFAPGDMLIYDTSKKSTSVPSILAVEIDGETMVRRVMPGPHGATLTCANEAYPPMTLDPEFKVLGRVVARLHRV